MSNDIVLDLHTDFAAACSKELRARGYTVPVGSAVHIIRAYANVRHRRVPQRQRKVHRAAYKVPTHLVAGEQAFLTAVGAVADLRPYQSTLLEKTDFNDGMLNDFGIHHFHLGTTPHPKKPGFVDRTEPVLFAMVRNNDFYSLGCHPHGAWSVTSLLDMVHANWPNVMAHSSLSSASGASVKVLGLSRQYTDTQIADLRKAGINALTQRPDGTVHIGAGGGATLGKQSLAVAHQIVQIKALSDQVERDLRKIVAPKLASGELRAPVKLRLEQRGVETFAVVDGGRGEYDLGRRLCVPLL